jgi:H+/Cl- antiporter ClcA
MDVPLYAIALVVFSVLYLGIGVFLGYTLVITLLVMFLYLVLRHGKLPDHYPHGFGDTMITAIFIGVTWGIFTFLAPKSPVPFLPTGTDGGLTYTHAVIPLGSFIVIAFVLAMVFLFIGAFFARDLRQSVGGGGTSSVSSSSEGDNKPKQGVGA